MEARTSSVESVITTIWIGLGAEEILSALFTGVESFGVLESVIAVIEIAGRDAEIRIRQRIRSVCFDRAGSVPANGTLYFQRPFSL